MFEYRIKKVELEALVNLECVLMINDFGKIEVFEITYINDVKLKGLFFEAIDCLKNCKLAVLGEHPINHGFEFRYSKS